MKNPFRPAISCLILWCLVAAPPRVWSEQPITATIISTLPTAGDHIRQFVFDGKPDTYFESASNAGANDSLTLRFNRPVAMRVVRVLTGRPDGHDPLNAGVLEVSTDGKHFERAARITGNSVRVPLHGQKVRAISLRPTKSLDHRLVIREIEVDSEPVVAVFRYPVEFELDVKDAPEMKAWAEKVARTCEQAYPRISDALRSPGDQPPHQVKLTLSNRFRGVAATGGSHIFGSVRYFKDHPDDVGAMIHETVHVVQHYRKRPTPGWLVEGIADYIRFFQYEPGKLGGIDPRTARYNGSYRVTAAFLAYVTKRYDKNVIRHLNQALREGRYSDQFFKDHTGKTLKELGQEWKASLQQ